MPAAGAVFQRRADADRARKGEKNLPGRRHWSKSWRPARRTAVPGGEPAPRFAILPPRPAVSWRGHAHAAAFPEYGDGAGAPVTIQRKNAVRGSMQAADKFLPGGGGGSRLFLCMKAV